MTRELKIDKEKIDTDENVFLRVYILFIYDYSIYKLRVSRKKISTLQRAWGQTFGCVSASPLFLDFLLFVSLRLNLRQPQIIHSRCLMEVSDQLRSVHKDDSF